MLQVKPLGVIWGKYPQWGKHNTIMFDDLRRNFLMNPKNGLKVCCNPTSTVAVVVEWLACLPVTQKIGVRFYLERESSATSGWINVGCEWCIEGGTPGGHLRTRDGTKNKEGAGRSQRPRVWECVWLKNIVPVLKWLPCMNACMCAVFHCICMCSN